MDIVIIIIVIVVICICCYIFINHSKNINGGGDYDDMMRNVDGALADTKRKLDDVKEKYEWFKNRYDAIDMTAMDIRRRGNPNQNFTPYARVKAGYEKSKFDEYVEQFNIVYNDTFK